MKYSRLVRRTTRNPKLDANAYRLASLQSRFAQAAARSGEPLAFWLVMLMHARTALRNEGQAVHGAGFNPGGASSPAARPRRTEVHASAARSEPRRAGTR